jgi:hypothetical protein
MVGDIFKLSTLRIECLSKVDRGKLMREELGAHEDVELYTSKTHKTRMQFKATKWTIPLQSSLGR